MATMRELLDHLGKAFAVRDPRALWLAATVEERCEFLARVEQFESFRSCIRDIEMHGLTFEQINIISDMQRSQMNSVTYHYWTPERFARSLGVHPPRAGTPASPGQVGTEQSKLPTQLSHLAF